MSGEGKPERNKREEGEREKRKNHTRSQRESVGLTFFFNSVNVVVRYKKTGAGRLINFFCCQLVN